MAELATLQTRLAEAETALHNLAMSKRPVTITFESRTVTYSDANIGQLKTYIEWLRSEIRNALAPDQSRAFTVQTNRGLS